MDADPGEETPTEPERRRPIGGAAAWRRVEVPPVRAAGDDRPERERYRRATLREQLAGIAQEILHNPPLLALLVFIVGGFLVLRALTPDAIRFEQLAAGDCLYVRAGSPDDARPIGLETDVRARILSLGAEQAACTLSHGHEVAAVVELAGDAWPGEAAVAQQAQPRCAPALVAAQAALPDGPSLALMIVAPDEERWAAGVRRAVCLVHRADGQFLEGR